MRALKVLVVVMGIVLVAGVGVVIVTIMTRLTRHQPITAAAPSAVAEKPVPFGTAVLNLPAGARIVEMQGAGRRLALHLRRADGSEAIVILDPDTGTALGTIELKPEN